MSMHNIPLTDIERVGLHAHKLPIGEPSQLSDAFRLGVRWAQQHSMQQPPPPFTEGKVRGNLKEPSGAPKPPLPLPPVPPPNRKVSAGGKVLNQEEIDNYNTMHATYQRLGTAVDAAIKEACKPLVDILNQISNWLVCYPMMTKDDVVETAPTFCKDIEDVLKEHQKKHYGE